MSLSFKHSFASGKGDGADPSLIQPSHWNAEHTITLATDTIIGRSSPGAGNAQEITCTAFGRTLIAYADAAALKTGLGYGALAALDTLEYVNIATDVPSTATEFNANTASKVLTPNAVWTAASPASVTANGTLTLDLNALINKEIVILGDVTLSVTNAKPGQMGVIEWVQNATPKNLTLSGGQFAYAGTVPNFVQTANAKFLMSYYVRRDGKVFISMGAALVFP